MTEVYRIEDLNVGDEIWISTEINRGFRRLGTTYRKRKVERITPKNIGVLLNNTVSVIGADTQSNKVTRLLLRVLNLIDKKATKLKAFGAERILVRESV